MPRKHTFRIYESVSKGYNKGSSLELEVVAMRTSHTNVQQASEIKCNPNQDNSRPKEDTNPWHRDDGTRSCSRLKVSSASVRNEGSNILGSGLSNEAQRPLGPPPAPPRPVKILSRPMEESSWMAWLKRTNGGGGHVCGAAPATSVAHARHHGQTVHGGGSQPVAALDLTRPSSDLTNHPSLR